MSSESGRNSTAGSSYKRSWKSLLTVTMSAKDQMAAMLDELMGKQRNAAPDERKETTFEDEDVCKFYLAGYCPNELFINTKADLGPCKSLHDAKLKDAYVQSDKFERNGYEEEFIAFLQRMVNDMERKIRKNRERLDLTQPGGQVALSLFLSFLSSSPYCLFWATDANKERLEEKQRNCDEKIQKYLTDAEQLGAEGKIEESQEAIRVSERYKLEKDQAHKALLSLMNGGMVPNDGDVKPMEVCGICGCFLIVGDAQSRVDEHYLGKQHLGFAKLRATLEELERRREEKLRLKREASEKMRSERDAARKERDRENEKEKEKEKPKDKDRDRKDHRDKDRRSDTSKRSDKDRSDRDKSDKDRRRGDRDRDSKRRRSRSRERDRRGGGSVGGSGDRRSGGGSDRRDRHRRDRSPVGGRAQRRRSRSRSPHETSAKRAVVDDVKRPRSPKFSMADVVEAVEARLPEYAGPPNRPPPSSLAAGRGKPPLIGDGPPVMEYGDVVAMAPPSKIEIQTSDETTPNKEEEEEKAAAGYGADEGSFDARERAALAAMLAHDPSEREDENDV